MKFLCDRCKTRYSIGDDRVRGKILKIRCKNCANVITVREGMSADESKALLSFLFRHSTQDAFVYRHVWSTNDAMRHALDFYRGAGGYPRKLGVTAQKCALIAVARCP